MNIKLADLIEAVEAMKQVVDLPVGQPIKHAQWERLMHAHSKLDARLFVMLLDKKVEVTND